MPTYEYECGRCGHRFEKFQQMSAKPVKKCPECKGKVRRLLSAGGAVLVRSGGGSAPEPPCARGGSCEDGCPMQRR